jgi:PRTRC genetic system protein B
MNLYDHNQTTPLKMTKAICLYEQAGRYLGAEEAGMHATIHDVTVAPSGKPMIGEGVTLTSSVVTNLLMRMRKTRKAGILPEHVLTIGENLTIWWTPPQKRTAWFKTKDEELNQAPISVFYPAFLYVLVGRSMSIYAFKGKKRPTVDTPLFHAPLMNIFERGGVCTGNVDFPKSVNLGKLDLWEKALLDSYFTHSNHSRNIKGIKGGMPQLLKNMKAGQYNSFPANCLSPFGLTLGKLIGHLQEVK